MPGAAQSLEEALERAQDGRGATVVNLAIVGLHACFYAMAEDLGPCAPIPAHEAAARVLADMDRVIERVMAEGDPAHAGLKTAWIRAVADPVRLAEAALKAQGVKIGKDVKKAIGQPKGISAGSLIWTIKDAFELYRFMWRETERVTEAAWKAASADERKRMMPKQPYLCTASATQVSSPAVTGEGWG
jgi:hypothetical protein